jgi:hypothetical protein
MANSTASIIIKPSAAFNRSDTFIFEDHVWFEERWMVASWCDE